MVDGFRNLENSTLHVMCDKGISSFFHSHQASYAIMNATATATIIETVAVGYLRRLFGRFNAHPSAAPCGERQKDGQVSGAGTVTLCCIMIDPFSLFLPQSESLRRLQIRV